MKENKKVLDACCGSRMFWFNKNDSRAIFIDNREETITVKDSSQRSGERLLSISPDIIVDFTNMPFEDETFWHVVFDPPHMTSLGETSWMAAKYGKLITGWEDVLQKGFKECMRVLKTNGTLNFKWNEYDIPVSKILALFKELGHEPLYGHRSGKQQKTHWISFIKINHTPNTGIN